MRLLSSGIFPSVLLTGIFSLHLTSEVVDAPSLETFQMRLDLSNLSSSGVPIPVGISELCGCGPWGQGAGVALAVLGSGWTQWSSPI